MERKKEVINICLDHFVKHGLDTSTRSLSKALQLQNAGLYYYFQSKDEAVLLCAEEAALRLEDALLVPALKDINNPDLMFKRLQSRADELTPTMRFFTSVCVNDKYRAQMKPALDRLDQRYDHYADMIAKKLNCKKEDIEPYVDIAITAVANYMIFAEEVFITPQMQIVKQVIKQIQNGLNENKKEVV